MLTIDPHAHFLFDTDDGPQTLDESLRMARLVAADGVTTVYCTSHLDTEDDVAGILADRRMKRTALQRGAGDAGLGITFLNGAEWMFSADLVAAVTAHPEGRLGGSRAFLFEISSYHPVGFVPAVVRTAVAAGFKPLFAHPERYRQLASENFRGALQPIVDAGACLQLTAASFTGLFGSRVEKLVWQILNVFPDDVVLASDAHESEVRVPGVNRVAALIEKKHPGITAAMQRRLEGLLASE